MKAEIVVLKAEITAPQKFMVAAEEAAATAAAKAAESDRAKDLMISDCRGQVNTVSTQMSMQNSTVDFLRTMLLNAQNMQAGNSNSQPRGASPSQ